MVKLLASIFIKDHTSYEEPRVRTAYGILAGVLGILMNFLLFGGKLAAGLITGSVSVTADAFNNLSDAGTSVVAIAGYKLAAMPADSEHPYGHGRAEYIAGFVVSGAIIFTAFEIGSEALTKIFEPSEINTGLVPMLILCASILIKLYMFVYNRRIGKLINSAPMKAVAVDSLSDCLSTGAVIIALAVYMLFGINIDGYIGLLIAVVILRAGISAAKDSITPLLGEKADDELISDIRATVLKNDNVLGIHDLAVHNYGVGRNIISLHAELPADMSFIEAHETVDLIETALREKFSASVTIHMDPIYEEDADTAGYREKVTAIIKEAEPTAEMHDFRVTERCGKRVLIFDVEVPFGLKISDEELKSHINSALAQYDSSLDTVICIDKKIY
ncbi:MAG: cation diffusion facilitator family transporter [Ruminiclostridium sp.]|nr:cation diffusion facilitator family transporter [Ruminiclostridium sp.]